MSVAEARHDATDQELLRRLREDGDPAAREALVERHLPLVRALARRFANRGEALDDLEQVGAIGLLKAIDRFEPARGVALSSYATPNVIGEIKRHFRDRSSAIRIPRGLAELSARAARTIEQLTGELGRSPSLAEIAEALETSPEDVLEALEAASARSVSSLSQLPMAGDGDDGTVDPLERVGAEDEELERSEERAVLEPALRDLAPREREILRMRFEEGLTQTEIAERVGISQMHVSRLVRRSLEQMRQSLAD